MRQRDKPRVVPDKKRYWNIEVEDQEPLTFRFPYYNTAYKVIDYVSTCPRGQASSLAHTAAMLPYMGAAIGACWWNKTFDLETPFDLGDLEAYGAGVADELQDLDLDMLQIVDLFTEVITEMKSRVGVTVVAQDTQDFSPAPEGAQITS